MSSSILFPFDKEFSLGKRLIDSFSEQFSFHVWAHNIKKHICDLDNIAISFSNNPHFTMVISDASIRNNITISVLYIHSHNKLVVKMVYHMVNVTTTEAKLFEIRCVISQAVGIPNVKHIVVITDSLHTAKKIFDTLTHPYQIHSATISQELRSFFKKYSNNCIKFWNCPSKQKCVKIARSRLCLFYFSFLFLFYFWFIFDFSIFRTLGLGL